MSQDKLNTTSDQINKDEKKSTGTPDTEKDKNHKAGKKLPGWLLSVLILLLLFLGVLSGYGSGVNQRVGAQNTQITGQLQEQFDLGIEAMYAGQYEVAKQHFEFVIENDPDFDGVIAAYSELLILMQATATLDFTFTPSISSTPDLRGAEVIYTNVRSSLSARDWDSVLTNLDSLRKTNPDYRTEEVDGLYYLALRMRGVGKIVLQEGETCPDINLEGGIYDLTMAERFGPLDAVAESLRTFSRLYVIGASYWDQDWEQVQYYFDQVRNGNPNLRDATCMSASERWRYATVMRAELFTAAGDYCAAEEQLTMAFNVSSDKNDPYFPTATEISVQCDGGDSGNETIPESETITIVPEINPTDTPTP